MLCLGMAPTHALLWHSAHSGSNWTPGPFSYFSGKTCPLILTARSYFRTLGPHSGRAPPSLMLHPGKAPTHASLEDEAHFCFPGAWRPLRQYWEHGTLHMSLKQGAQFLGSLGKAPTLAPLGHGGTLALCGQRRSHSCFTPAQCPSYKYLPQARRPLMRRWGTGPTPASVGHDAHSDLGLEAAPPNLMSNTHNFAPVGRLSKPPAMTAATEPVHSGCNLLAHRN